MSARSLKTASRALRVSNLLFLSVGVLLLVSLVMPMPAAARCFGVPLPSEGPGREAAWSLEIEVATANGARSKVLLGFHPDATDGYDELFDVQLRTSTQPRLEAGEVTLFAYFVDPGDIGKTRGDSEVIEPGVGLSKSIIAPKSVMIWPLQIFYFYFQPTTINITWGGSGETGLREFGMELITPSGDMISMANVSGYSFFATQGIHDFIVRGEGSLEESDGEAQLIAGALTAYVLSMAIILWLRRLRRRRK